MALVNESLVLGITSVAMVLSCLVFGLICIARGIRNREKLLNAAGLNIIITGSYMLGTAVEFFAVIIFEVHLSPPELYILLSYTQIPFGVMFMGILAGELIMPNYKDAVLGALTALGFVFMGFILSFLYIVMTELPYIFPTFGIIVPPNLDYLMMDTLHPGLVNGFTPYSEALYLLFFFDFAVFFLLVIGSLVKAYQSSGLLRRKFIYLAIGFGVFVFGSLSDKFIDIYAEDWGMYWIAIS
ncbi:MAG: hypothetical protein ACFE8P_12505, partial [Promethearchaeota archaeon]